MSSMYTICKSAVGRRIAVIGTLGDEYDKQNYGKWFAGIGMCRDCVTGHGLCILIDDTWVDPIHIEVID